MAARRRIRTVKPEFYEDEKVGLLSIEERYFFIGLFSLADDEGRIRWISRSILGDLFPYDDGLTARKIERWTKNLEKSSLIVRYKVNGRTYCQIKNWGKHQTIAKAKPSILPPLKESHLDLSGTSTVQLPDPVLDKDSTRTEGVRYSRENMEGKGGERKGYNPHTPLEGDSLGSQTVRELFDYWRERCNHPRTVLDDKRRRKIAARLKDGVSADDIRLAIDGAAVAPFINDRGERFDDIELICRDASKLDSFIKRAKVTVEQNLNVDAVMAKSRREMERARDLAKTLDNLPEVQL